MTNPNEELEPITCVELSTVTGGFNGFVPKQGDPEYRQAIAAGFTPLSLRAFGHAVDQQVRSGNDRAHDAFAQELAFRQRHVVQPHKLPWHRAGAGGTIE